MLDAYDHANTTMTIIRPTADVRGGGQTTGVVTSAEGGSAGMRLSIETTTGTDRIGASERRGLRLSHARNSSEGRYNGLRAPWRLPR